MKKKADKANNEPEKICCHCEFSTVMGDNSSCVCKFGGVVRADDTCKKYKLDLLKLKPVLPILPDSSSMKKYMT